MLTKSWGLSDLIEHESKNFQEFDCEGKITDFIKRGNNIIKNNKMVLINESEYEYGNNDGSYSMVNFESKSCSCLIKWYESIQEKWQ